MNWSDAIVEVLQKHDGATTLSILYAKVPQLVTRHNADDTDHVIRGYLYRLKGQQKVKRIGLATYAVADFTVENPVFNEIANKTIKEENFVALPETKLHGHLQGMLIEIGNMKNFQTYTPDKNVVLNGKPLSEIVSLDTIPQFTYADRLDLIRQIDVIWFKDGYPVQTFDVENSTNFTTAFLRSYQLKYFKTKCFMIADAKKKNVFKKRMATKPFDEIKDNVTLVENSFVFQTYKQLMHMLELRRDNPIL